jgi:phospholipid/cholesterol/gamma-HCH transport system substrate-binding protein
VTQHARLRRERTTNQVRGVVAVAALAVMAYGVHGAYTRAWSDDVTIHLSADRSGLLLEPGADVALSNVSVGRVTEVDVTAGGADIELAVDRDAAALVDPDARVAIVSPTLLGPKYVDLTVAAGGAGLKDGQRIAADEVQVEANAAFEHLVSVLNGVQPAQLTTALGALSTTLDRRGDELGSYLDQANAYFARFNESLPAMERDLDAAADVARIYADIAPELLALLDSTTTTARTVVDRSEAMDALLLSLRQTSDTTRSFLATNRVGLRDSMRLLLPTTTTLSRYAPMFPCLFRTLNDYRKTVEPASGGIYPGLWVHLSVLPGADGYDKATELPRVRADQPTCSGGPLGPDGHYVPGGYDDGTRPMDNTGSPLTLRDEPLVVELFGKDVANLLTGGAAR